VPTILEPIQQDGIDKTLTQLFRYRKDLTAYLDIQASQITKFTFQRFTGSMNASWSRFFCPEHRINRDGRRGGI